MKIKLPELIWYGGGAIEIELPTDWDVALSPMRGATDKPMSISEMDECLKKPIGSGRLKEIAKGKKSAVIIFDDITRPTRVYEIAPLVIRELTSGGIDEEDITFVCALGNHGAHTNHEFRKKLGVEIVEKFRIFNHNPYENCDYVGKTKRGTKLMVNREVMGADVKVGIGCVTAHANVGFSGGGKILLPGVSHIKSAAHYHMEVYDTAPDTTGLGNFDDNVMRFEIEEAARMAGLDFKVDVVVNGLGETTALFAGDFVAEHTEAVKLAKSVYALDPPPENCDIIISNAYAKANEMFIALRLGEMAHRGSSGTVVVIANAPEGQIPHYFQRSFGRDYGGKHYPISEIGENLDVVVVAPYLDKNFADWVENPELITWTKSWDEAIGHLKKSFGSGTKVGVIPNATISYIE
jgi:nickel-dependent lactate racemase